MKIRAILIFLIMCLSASSIKAQTLYSPTDSLPQAPAGFYYADTIVVRYLPKVDTLLKDKNIFNEIPNATVRQSSEISFAMGEHISKNVTRTLSGYRVRIYFDNSQDARSGSERIQRAFEVQYPGVPTYRSYTYPFFKVTVGDFRTKSQAMKFLNKIKKHYQAAFLVRENISYPAIDSENAYILDTLMVLKPVKL
ncbi:MAG: SPOR domain-containing protein [Bacteroidales bacterium]|nr:SPOR domain-containing protein [Bacteroidales bacterium]